MASDLKFPNKPAGDLYRHARHRKAHGVLSAAALSHWLCHQFRPLGVPDMRRRLEQRWAPAGVKFPDHGFPKEAAAFMRTTAGNFRLPNRMLAQIERILEIDGLQEITKDVIEAVRESGNRAGVILCQLRLA